MSKKYLHDEVEKFIDKNRIHLESYAIFDGKLFKNPEQMEKEITHGKVILTNSVGEFLMNKDRINKYATESKEMDQDNEELSRISFSCFVFSGDQLRAFVEMVHKSKGKIISLEEARVLN